MNKLAAEQNAIVGAMQKIASANGLPLTFPVAQRIAELHAYSPVLIMKTAAEMTPEDALQWQTYRANMVPNMTTGMFPGVGPLIASGLTPGWDSSISRTILPHLLGAGLGGAAGAGLGALIGAPVGGGILGAMGGGALGSYIGGRHYAPSGSPITPDILANPVVGGYALGGLLGSPFGAIAHRRLPESAHFA